MFFKLNHCINFFKNIKSMFYFNFPCEFFKKYTVQISALNDSDNKYAQRKENRGFRIQYTRFSIEITKKLTCFVSKWKNIEYNILMMGMEKRRELKQLVVGMPRKKQRHYKIYIKIQKERVDSGKNESILPLFQLGLYFFEAYQDIEHFYQQIHKEIHYAVHKLFKPDAFLIECKKITLSLQKEKLLLLDLDETLIYSSEDLENPDFELFHKNIYLKLNIRPYCSVFLKNLSEIYDIFIFTSATVQYAEPIVKFLNSGKGYIKGILHREHCLKTKNGLFIKDLRIIRNAEMSNTVIVDNKIHSFSFQLDNGIPIKSFSQNRNDKVLINLEKFLIELSREPDIPQFLDKKLGLLKITEHAPQRKLQGFEKCLKFKNFRRRNYQRVLDKRQDYI